MNDGDVTRFRDVLADRLGWTFDENDSSQLGQVLAKRADAHRLTGSAYLTRLGATDWDAELTTLAAELTIGETYFFRHGEQFRALADVALPERLRARATQRVLRMLSVGCSSGEEAFTMAIVARELQPDPDWIVSVLGLDANPVVLRRAATARYSAWSLRETPDAIRQRWFRHRDGGYELDGTIRAAVQFRQYNVAADGGSLWHADQYDVVFCRNLLMYLTPAVAETLIARMTRSLAPGGYLFLGHTDSLGSRPEGLESQHTHQTFYYRRPVGAIAPRPAPVVPAKEKRPSRPLRKLAEPDLYDRALHLVRDESFAQALTMLEDARIDRPAPRDELLHSVVLAHTGRLGDAEAICRRLLDADGLYADAHHQLAVCLEGSAAIDVAIGHYRMAAYLDPEFAMPRMRTGLLARRRGETRIAGTELERALALLRQEREDRIVLFGGGFSRIALTNLCRAEMETRGAHR